MMVVIPHGDGIAWSVQTRASCHVDIWPMAFGNLRVVLATLDRSSYGRAWCYQRPLIEVAMLAAAFNPEAGEEPIGWVKEVGTERRACNGYYPRIRDGHLAYDPDCANCGDERLFA